jgi:hypothetical protein
LLQSERRIVRVSNRDSASIDVRSQSINDVEDRLRHAASLVDDHQQVAGVDALERCLVVVSGLTPVRDKLVADLPLGIERDSLWAAAFLWALPTYRHTIASTCEWSEQSHRDRQRSLGIAMAARAGYTRQQQSTN